MLQFTCSLLGYGGVLTLYIAYGLRAVIIAIMAMLVLALVLRVTTGRAFE